MDKYKFIISLGSDCFFRSLIDRYSLRDKFNIRMPFDGSVHPYETVCHLIETDFNDYLDNIVFENNNFYNKKLNITWNHEKTKDLISFKNHNKLRVKQFLDTINMNKGIIFTLHYNDLNNNDFRPDKLVEILNNKYAQLKYKIFIFNNMNKDFFKYTNDNIYYLNIPYQSPNLNKIHYNNFSIINNLFIKEMYNTKYGKIFAEKILFYLLECMEDNKNYILNKNYNFNDELNND